MHNLCRPAPAVGLRPGTCRVPYRARASEARRDGWTLRGASARSRARARRGSQPRWPATAVVVTGNRARRIGAVAWFGPSSVPSMTWIPGYRSRQVGVEGKPGPATRSSPLSWRASGTGASASAGGFSTNAKATPSLSRHTRGEFLVLGHGSAWSPSWRCRSATDPACAIPLAAREAQVPARPAMRRPVWSACLLSASVSAESAARRPPSTVEAGRAAKRSRCLLGGAPISIAVHADRASAATATRTTDRSLPKDLAPGVMARSRICVCTAPARSRLRRVSTPSGGDHPCPATPMPHLTASQQRREASSIGDVVEFRRSAAASRLTTCRECPGPAGIGLSIARRHCHSGQCPERGTGRPSRGGRLACCIRVCARVAPVPVRCRPGARVTASR